MAETVRLLKPHQLSRNKENPRLIFREDELQSLQESIQNQGILVPLTVFRDGSKYILLDGERRWRCALKLGLSSVPVIIQPKPDRLQNIMMMFAIHQARKEWDPLPTAMKLQQLEGVLERRHGKPPTEAALAAAASMSRGEVRRYRKILNLPEKFKLELMEELEKPRGDQNLTVDQVLESTKGSKALTKRHIINEDEQEQLNQALVEKFRNKTIKNTVAPRKLARLARAVERNELPKQSARRVIKKLISRPQYTIDKAFEDSVAQVDFEHSVEQLASRLESKLREHQERGYKPSQQFLETIQELLDAIHDVMNS